MSIYVSVEFSGGLEALFDGHKLLSINLTKGCDIKGLLERLKLDYIKERPELFIQGNSMYHTSIANILV
jgi:hypothetical protein